MEGKLDKFKMGNVRFGILQIGVIFNSPASLNKYSENIVQNRNFYVTIASVCAVALGWLFGDANTYSV